MSSEAAGSKRSSEEHSEEFGKKARGDSLILRFLLKSRYAGGIIGKGGETIKRLRSEFSASVTVPDTDTGERVLSIGADQENCMKVVKECLPLLHEPPYKVSSGRGGDSQDDDHYEVNFLINSSQVGGIIGKAGAIIKQIREESNARVKVYQDCLPDSTERVIAIGGDKEQIAGAIERMLEILKDQPIKGNITLYDPTYDHSHGGFDNFNYGMGNNFHGPPGRNGYGMRDMRGNRMSNGRGRSGMGGRDHFGQGPQGDYAGGGGMGQDFGDNFGGSDSYSYSSSQGSDFGGGGGNFNSNSFGNGNGNNSNSPASTTQVTVPNDMAGSIIGKGGERIRQIRQKSGAEVRFSDSDPSKKDRLITINGTQEQIQYAQYLMQQSVRQSFHT